VLQNLDLFFTFNPSYFYIFSYDGLNEKRIKLSFAAVFMHLGKCQFDYLAKYAF